VETKTVPNLASVSYGYLLSGETQSVAQNGYSVDYDYDGAGRKRYENNAGLQVGYQYDEAGNRARTIWPDGYYVAYEYDTLNRMAYAWENSTSANELAYYQYDPLGRRQSLRLGGTATNRAGYTWEPDGGLDLLTHTLNAATVTLDHDHLPSGRLQRITANDDFYLPQVATATAYAPNRLNQYASVGGRPNPPMHQCRCTGAELYSNQSIGSSASRRTIRRLSHDVPGSVS
jgi:YD repeat-containing protein